MVLLGFAKGACLLLEGLISSCPVVTAQVLPLLDFV